MLIQDFMKHNIDGIKLKEGLVTDCPTCSTKKENQMTIREIKEELKVSDHPVAKSLQHGTNFKVLIIGFNKGMILKEHKSHIRTKLTVLEGDVIYKEGNRIQELMQYEEVEIPIEITHSVEAIKDSLCILIQGE